MEEEKIGFDSIYTGYLGTIKQIDIIADVFDQFKTDNNQIIVDPMADNGKLYPAFDEAYAKKMAWLCGKADIMIPNITEASFMVDMEYKDSYDQSYIKEMLKRLTDLGAKIAILTGVSFDDQFTGVMGLDKQSNEFFHYKHDKINRCYTEPAISLPAPCWSTGNGLSWKEATPIAADYTAL